MRSGEVATTEFSGVFASRSEEVADHFPNEENRGYEIKGSASEKEAEVAKEGEEEERKKEVEEEPYSVTA